MQNLKTITAEGFAVNFLLSNVSGYFGDAKEECYRLLKDKSGEILLFAYDKGYFALGKSIKDRLVESGKKVSCFCFDEQCDLQSSLKKIFNETSNSACIIVIQDSYLATAVKQNASENCLFLYLPTDFEFGAFLLDENSKNSSVIFDKNTFFNIKKNKLLNGIKSVLSKRLIYIEMLVYELIEGFFDKNEAYFAFEEGQNAVREYFKKPNIKTLVLAQFYCSVATGCLPVSYMPNFCALIAQKTQNSADICDLEFTFYKLILKIYCLYFNNEINFITRLPNPLDEIQQLKEMGFSPCEKMPNFLFDNDRVRNIQKAFNSNVNLINITTEQLLQTDSFKQTFKKVYAGRKYTVEHYGEKERAKAISLSVNLSQKLCALKVIWADGVLQYFN